MVGFPLFSVIVCSWLTRQNLHRRPASVGLAQACPNNLIVGNIQLPYNDNNQCSVQCMKIIEYTQVDNGYHYQLFSCNNIT